jgi:hypothetical protein
MTLDKAPVTHILALQVVYRPLCSLTGLDKSFGRKFILLGRDFGQVSSVMRQGSRSLNCCQLFEETKAMDRIPCTEAGTYKV